MRAKDPEILEAVKKVLKESMVVHSQAELLEKVKQKLSEKEDVQVSAERIRRVTKKHGIRIQVHSRKGKDLKACPFCEKDMQDILSKDLFGESTAIGKVCKKCKFEIALGRSPGRYVFRR